MAQPLQPEAADGGANMALLCAAQKLLCAAAILPARPKNAEAPTWKISSCCSWEGVMGQDSAPYNRTESTKLPYTRVLM